MISPSWAASGVAKAVCIAGSHGITTAEAGVAPASMVTPSEAVSVAAVSAPKPALAWMREVVG